MAELRLFALAVSIIFLTCIKRIYHEDLSYVNTTGLVLRADHQIGFLGILFWSKVIAPLQKK